MGRGMKTKAAAIFLGVLCFSSCACASPGCDDLNALCKDATTKAAQCVRNPDKSEFPCHDLEQVRYATCLQAKIICADDITPPQH